MSFQDEVLDKIIEHPIASMALLDLLIEDGVRIDIDVRTISHTQRKIILREIVAELSRRDTLQ